MSLTELFKGIAVVIDDEIEDENANIHNLLTQIKAENMPYIPYIALPTKAEIVHWKGISFILLDWKLRKEGGEITDPEIKQNIEFLKLAKEMCFAPIFIFTNQGVDDIERILVEQNVYTENQKNIIFIKSKSDLIESEKMFAEITEWIKETPSIYVLKAWEKEYYKAKNLLFNNFYEINSNWPVILWKNYKEDDVNMSKELSETISKNLYSRMSPFSFEESFLEIDIPEVKSDDVRKVIEGERFLKILHDDDIGTGDLFKEEYDDQGITKFRYLLNIRAQCDLIRGNADDVNLYCLKGRVFESSAINTDDGIRFENGQFIEKVNHSILPCLDDGKLIEFLFRDLKIYKWKNYKSKRIGRLLPPYITRIQQRYALYLIRQGLPRVPDEAIPEKPAEEKVKDK